MLACANRGSGLAKQRILYKQFSSLASQSNLFSPSRRFEVKLFPQFTLISQAKKIAEIMSWFRALGRVGKSFGSLRRWAGRGLRRALAWTYQLVVVVILVVGWSLCRSGLWFLGRRCWIHGCCLSVRRLWRLHAGGRRLCSFDQHGHDWDSTAYRCGCDGRPFGDGGLRILELE